MAVLGLLAQRGDHRAPSIPDLLIAAIAESAGLVVLHDDKHFELIGEITGQPTERLGDGRSTSGRHPNRHPDLVSSPVDSVLTGARPRLTTADAVEIGATLFGVQRATHGTSAASATARSCWSRRSAILKVSNASEDPDVLDMEAAVALHVTAVDPELRVARARGRRRRRGDLRARWARTLGAALRPAAGQQPDHRHRALGRGAGRVGRDDRAPRAGAARLRAPAERSESCSGTSSTRSAPARCSTTSATRARGRRSRACSTSSSAASRRSGRGCARRSCHTDLTVDNTLTDDAGFITGIIDFGDMSHTALITDLASVLDSVCGGRDGRRAVPRRAPGPRRLPAPGRARGPRARGRWASRWAARSAVTIAISSWRVAQGLEDQEFAERYNAICAADDRDDGGGRLGRAGAAIRRRRSAHARPVAGGAPRRGVRAGDRPAVLRGADRGAARRGRLDHRHRRPHLPRRVQQRARASGTRTRA